MAAGKFNCAFFSVDRFVIKLTFVANLASFARHEPVL